MTRLVRSKKKPRQRVWPLQDAKAHFSELVRNAREVGPQRVTMHGKDAVVVVSVEQFAAMEATQKISLREFLLNSPLRDLEFDRKTYFPPYRPPEEL